MTTDTHLEGSCLCGQVRFRLSGELRPVSYCHCSQCRKTHGHFAAYTHAHESQLQFQDKSGLKWYASSGFARRGFCGNCGASLFWHCDGSGGISIAAGCLDAPTGLRADRHIFASDASDYYQITDGLEIFPQEG